MNHKDRLKAAINRYEWACNEHEAKVQQFHDYQAQIDGDIRNLDQVIAGSLQNIEQARQHDKYGAPVKEALDDMPELSTIGQYYGFGAFGNNHVGRSFDSLSNGGVSGAGYTAGAGAAGIGAGIGAVAGAYGLAGAIGVASTGTAIGGLSGAAATSASLAWLGGGALAAGGLGMAGGLVALTGIGLAPLAAAGITAGIIYKKRNKKRADALEEEVEGKIAAMQQAHAGMAHGKEILSQLGSTARQHAAHIRVLNNRHLGPAMQAGDAEPVANPAKLLITSIYEAITEIQDLWNKTAGQSIGETRAANAPAT